ncbi:MAG: LuxR family transcriptional regulator [Pseudomonadota bacterium]
MIWSDTSQYTETDTADAVTPRMSEFVQSLGLDHFSFLFLKLPNTSVEIENTLYCSYPSEWIGRYLDRHYAHLDPVTRAGQAAIRPFYWGSGRFLRAYGKRQRRVFEEANVFHISHGISIPTRGPIGELSIFSVVSDNKKRLFDAVEEVTPELMTAAFDTHERVLADTEAALARQPEVKLTPREKECLHWTLSGKTAAEVAEVLGIAVSTVNQHVQSAATKLGCLNKHHAAVHAFRRNLI